MSIGMTLARGERSKTEKLICLGISGERGGLTNAPQDGTLHPAWYRVLCLQLR